MSLDVIRQNLDERLENSATSLKSEVNLPKLGGYSEIINSTPFISTINVDSTYSVNNRIDYSEISNTAAKKSTEYKKGKKFQRLTWNNELYEGDTLLNNLHGNGFFLTQKNGQNIFYDGLFYVNKLEGYSQIFYGTGTHFQGLFKQHKRYGPGVLTYSNGTQDVGFWNGFRLFRLASVVGSDTVPKLVTTTLGKTKLLCYRYLVPLYDENEDLVTNILKNIGANDEVLERADEVLNFTIRNSNSLFFPKKKFDHYFFNGKDCTIKVALDEHDIAGTAESFEEPKQTHEYDIFNRINYLKAKIKDVDESIQPFVAIKENILEKIRYCRKCCVGKESIELSKIVESDRVASQTTAPVFTTDVVQSPSDLTGLVPDSSFYDPSLSSASTLPEFVVEKQVKQISEKSSKQKIIEFCSCGEQREIEDLHHLEDQLENIEKQETFYRNISDNLQKKVYRLIEKEESIRKNIQPKVKLVKVTELLAWNNEELLMQIQKHCFRHRNSEDMVNFSVPNLILGNRKDFGNAGEHEEICHKFLSACGKGHKDFVRRCLREKINPNLCDARGNSGIFFAAATDHIEIISILTDWGAKLDQINDEELTPLSLCVLRYLSQKNMCNSWEKAFLTETEICKTSSLPKWYDIQSLLSSTSTSSKHSDSVDKQSSQNDYSNSRIVELFRRLSTLQQNTSSFIRNVPNNAYVLDLSYKLSSSSEKEVEGRNNEVIRNELKATHLTIMTLLDYGADPNVAKVPYPPLVLSLFTENSDLVSQLLEANSDVDVLVTDDELSCLHIISSLGISDSNVEICRLLLMHKCDPNLKTTPNHWHDVKQYFIGNIPKDFFIEDSGKNALHILCMRKDFENDNHDYFGSMAKNLIEGGIDVNETFLGHTPLSLAVLAGNIRLVKYLIELNIFDPYKNLDNEMGNILTLFTLKRYDNTLPTDKCKAMLTSLVESGINVLHKVEDVENAIEFAEEGDALFNLKVLSKDDKKLEKAKTKSTSKPKNANKHSQCSIMKEFIKDLGRETIIKRVQILSTQILYDFIEEDILENTKIAVALAEFLTPQLVIENLETLYHSEKIDPQRVNTDYIKKLLTFVDLYKKNIKTKKGAKAPKEPKGKQAKNLTHATSPEEATDLLIASANFKKSAVPAIANYFVAKPGFDDPAMYKVCFHCLKGIDKELKLCPRCQMVRFCSPQCNKLNLKVKSLHTCHILSYDMADEERQDITNNECLLQLAKSANDNCLIRLQKKRESRLLQEEMKLLEMWRADTYGTKFLKFKPLLQKATKKRKGKELSLNLDGLKNLLERNFQKNPADFDSYSIEAMLAKLNSRQRIKESRKSSVRPSRNSRLQSTVGSLFSEYLAEVKEEKQPICKCSEKIKHTKQKPKEKSGGHKKLNAHLKRPTEMMKSTYIKGNLPSKFEDCYADISVREITDTITKKLKKIPSKYQRFIKIMGTYFPEVDMSNLLLPYACCSNGQLFYKFCDNEIFRESYSLT